MARPMRESTQTTKDFSERLSELVEERKKQGSSQKDIAAGIGIASGTLSDWCSDNKTPTIDAVPKIASYFGVSVEWLFGLSNDRSVRSSTVDELGLTPKAVDYLRRCSSEYVLTNGIISQLIEHPEFEKMVEYIGLAMDTAPMDAAQVQSEFEKFRQILLDQAHERHTQAGKKVAALLLETDSVAELDTIVNILADSALDSVVLNREDARKFYIAEAQKALNRIVEEIK